MENASRNHYTNMVLHLKVAVFSLDEILTDFHLCFFLILELTIKEI